MKRPVPAAGIGRGLEAPRPPRPPALPHGAPRRAPRRAAGARSEYFGEGLAGGADLDGDGSPELAIGASDGLDDDSGLVGVFTAPFTGLRDLATADAGLSGSAPGQALGATLTNLGDIDGDGGDDLAVGLQGEWEGNPYRTVLLWRGADVW